MHNARTVKSKGIPRQAEVALGVPGRLRPRIYSTFGTKRVVGHQSNAPAAFTPAEIPGTHFQRLSRPQDTWFCRKEPREKSQVTPPGIDPGTVRLVAQCLNHYATPGPNAHTVVIPNQPNTQIRIPWPTANSINNGSLHTRVYTLFLITNIIFPAPLKLE